MEEVTLKAMLSEAAQKTTGTTYQFTNSRTNLLVAADSELITIDKVSEVKVLDGFVAIQGSRETFYVPWSRIVGLRLSDGAGESQSGFLR